MSFSSKNEIGKKYEKYVRDYLVNIKGVKDLIDVSDVEEYRQRDIDIICTSQSEDKDKKYFNKRFKIEVKHDFKIEKGNLFLEDRHERPSKRGNKNGWMWYCEADVLFYCCGSQCYSIPFQPFKEYGLSKGTHIRFYNNEDNVYSWGYIVPIKDAIANNLINRIYDISCVQ